MLCFETWYCMAYLYVGGLFEATAPYGVFVAVTIIAVGLAK